MTRITRLLVHISRYVFDLLDDILFAFGLTNRDEEWKNESANERTNDAAAQACKRDSHERHTRNDTAVTHDTCALALALSLARV